MAFDNEHPNRKDWRRPYRGAGRVDRSCRPGGDCPWCQENRAFGDRRREPADINEQLSEDTMENTMQQVAIAKRFVASAFANRVNPLTLGFSPKMAAIVGAIIKHDYGVRNAEGGKPSSIAITSDGFVVADSQFIGGVSDLARNLEKWKQELTPADRAEFERLYAQNVEDWRLFKHNNGDLQVFTSWDGEVQ